MNPLLSTSCSDREINAIENEFNLAKSDDDSRSQQLFCSSSNNKNIVDFEPSSKIVTLNAFSNALISPSDHSSVHHTVKKRIASSNNEHSCNDLNSHYFWKKFSWGNLYSLHDVPSEKKCDVSFLLRKFWERYHTPDRMQLVVLSTLPVAEMKRAVVTSFYPWTTGGVTIGTSNIRKEVCNSSNSEQVSITSVSETATEYKRMKIESQSNNVDIHMKNNVHCMNSNSINSNKCLLPLEYNEKDYNQMNHPKWKFPYVIPTIPSISTLMG